MRTYMPYCGCPVGGSPGVAPVASRRGAAPPTAAASGPSPGAVTARAGSSVPRHVHVAVQHNVVIGCISAVRRPAYLPLSFLSFHALSWNLDRLEFAENVLINI